MNKPKTKYLFDLIGYRYWQGKKIETKRDSIQVDTGRGKGYAMGKAVRLFVRSGEARDFVTVEILTARVGDANR